MPSSPFEVFLTHTAQVNLRYYYRRAAVAAPKTAARWLNRFESTLKKSLSHNPTRFPVAPESEAVGTEVRRFLFGRGARDSYRALFIVQDRAVYVLHIRRAQMDFATKDDLLD